ncbi:hypothetical protein [Marinomonas atlantica]|uniref:hypothetical protein n=1 Tax=Marinomonas atlantica TaxID=1806668 RepID=UPI00082D7DA8|nr:hypothetical protein [Marinomonas atlantica]MCO4784379.1 hypothetical protein [Marinomonas atlantica]
MKHSILLSFISSKYLKWLLLVECFAVAWGIHKLWQHKLERQTALDRYLYQEQQWRRIAQSLKTLPQRFPVTLLEQNGTVIGMRMTASMSLPQWATVLETMQQHFWLTPETIVWQRLEHKWKADVRWQLLRPSTLKPAINILPFDQRVYRPLPGELISTVHGNQSAALIKVNQKELWFHEGHWSPDLQATLALIDQDFVILQSAQGHTQKLFMTGLNTLEQSQKEY